MTSTRVLALLNGSIDMTDSYLPVDQVENIQKSATAHVANATQTMRVFLIRMNNKKPPFDNINARKCFAHAFNYDGFIKEILKGNAERDPAPLPNTIWGFPKDVAGYEYDLKKAKDYLPEGGRRGAPMKRPIEIHILQQLEQTTQAAQVFQSDLATIGINLKIVSRHLRQPDHQRRQGGDHARHVDPLGQHLFRRSRRTGSARCTTASSTAPGRRRPGTRTRRSTSCCARRAA